MKVTINKIRSPLVKFRVLDLGIGLLLSFSAQSEVRKIGTKCFRSFINAFDMLVPSVSSREIGTENFPGNLGFFNFPFPGKFMSGSREIFLH